MSGPDRSDLLEQIVEKAIEEHKLVKFAEYWELYRNTADISSIQRFFVRTKANTDPFFGGAYCNVAIIGDGLLVDIEGDDSQSSGGLRIESLETVSSVIFHVGSLPGLRNSQNASLVVIADQVGETGVGLHWVAKTEEEEEHLVQFGRSLVQAISNR